MRRGSIWTAVPLGGAGCLTASGAWAAGFAVRENCTEGMGTIFAGGGSLAET